jgi:hypothetical protein
MLDKLQHVIFNVDASLEALLLLHEFIGGMRNDSSAVFGVLSDIPLYSCSNLGPRCKCITRLPLELKYYNWRSVWYATAWSVIWLI